MKPIDFTCPECLALPGEPCKPLPDETPFFYFHGSRIAKASATVSSAVTDEEWKRAVGAAGEEYA